jgi:hypothetical protein
MIMTHWYKENEAQRLIIIIIIIIIIMMEPHSIFNIRYSYALLLLSSLYDCMLVE